MSAIAICLMAFLLCFAARRKGLAEGILAVLFFGYAYGIIRANLRVTWSHFLFDSALLGLYASELLARVSSAQRLKEARLREWLVVLTILPSLLLLLPIQEPLVQLVGFRAAVLFLPFFLLGARLDSKEIRRLAIGIAALNLAAFGMAMLEFARGVEPFYPKSPVTDIIFRSKDVMGWSFFRIPATFTNSAVYGGTMVLTLPLVFVALSGRSLRPAWKILCLAGVFAALIAVFMSASRSAAVLLLVTLTAALFEHRRTKWGLGLIAAIGGVAALVAAEPRLQRFLTLGDLAFVRRRFFGSVNLTAIESISRYPFGNGLGAGGTSLPFFLENRVVNRVVVENEYARLALEQGIVGLALWVAFIAWLLWGPVTMHGKSGLFSIRVTCAAAFLIALTGTGLTFAIPSTALFFLMLGWMVAARAPRAPRAPRALVAVRRRAVTTTVATAAAAP